jgi:hypothetical protein
MTHILATGFNLWYMDCEIQLECRRHGTQRYLFTDFLINHLPVGRTYGTRQFDGPLNTPQ